MQLGNLNNRLLTLLGLILCTSVLAQDNIKVLESDQVPDVFLIGQFQESHAALNNDYPSSLLTVKSNNMAEAYGEWINVLKQMEHVGEQVGFNLRGVKLWMQLYWSAEGEIKHISYFLKPNSRVVPEESLRAFFKVFMTEFRMAEASYQNYNHYGSASFPVNTE